MEQEKFTPAFEAIELGRSWSDFLKYFRSSGRAFSQVLGGECSQQESDDLQLIRRRFSYSFVWVFMLDCPWRIQVPAVICPRLLHDILSQIFTALQPASSSCWERHLPPLWGFNEEPASWACLQHFPIFLWKMHHILKEKARRGLRELCSCAVQKGTSSQETATTIKTSALQ